MITNYAKVLQVLTESKVQEQQRSLAPISRGVLARAYRRLKRDEKQQDRVLARASAYPANGELDH
jgi:hypothetical protein